VGINRLVWDMKTQSMNGIPGVYIEANYRGHKVIPGTYKVRLTSGEESSVQEFQILANPKYTTTAAEYEEFDKFMTSGEAAVREMHSKVNELFASKKRISEIKKTLKANDESHKVVMSSLDQLVKDIEAWDNDMIQRKSKAYDDVENFPNKFTAEYLFISAYAIKPS